MMIKDQPWFVAMDVCSSLRISRTNDAVQKLDDDEKLMRKVSASGQDRLMWTVNESGLYNLIFRSNKAEAKAFRKWVTAEVLPAIRKTGFYGVQQHRALSETDTTLQKAITLSGSQQKLAYRLGVSAATVSDYIHGGSKLAADMRQRLTPCYSHHSRAWK